MFNPAEFRAGWQLISPMLPASTRRFPSQFYEMAGDPDPVTARQVFITRHSLLRAWGEFQETRALIVAPIYTGIPFEAGIDLADGAVTETIPGMRMAIAVNVPGLPAAVPVGTADGLPQVVQVIGPRYREDLYLDAAATLEDRLGVITPIDPRQRSCGQHDGTRRKDAAMSASRTQSKLRAAVQAPPGINDVGLKSTVAEVVDRWPSAGLAAGVVHGGTLEWFDGYRQDAGAARGR